MVSVALDLMLCTPFECGWIVVLWGRCELV